MNDDQNDQQIPHHMRLYTLQADLTELLNKFPGEQFGKKLAWDEESEDDFVRILTNISRFFRDLSVLSLERLPSEKLERLGYLIQAIKSDLSELVRAERGEVPRNFVREEYASRVLGALGDKFGIVLTEFSPWVAYLLLEKSPIDNLGELRNTIESIRNEQIEIDRLIADRIAVSMKTHNADIQKITEIRTAAEQAAGQIGVNKYSKTFSEIRDGHRTLGAIWLAITTLLIVLTAILPIYLSSAFPAGEQWNSPTTIQSFGFKVLIMSVAFYLIAQCAKNYRSHRHLEVTNRHRATALLTFKSFVESDESPEIRSAILLEASRTVFAPATTGYIQTEDDGPDSRIFEIIRAIRGEKK